MDTFDSELPKEEVGPKPVQPLAAEQAAPVQNPAPAWEQIPHRVQQIPPQRVPYGYGQWGNQYPPQGYVPPQPYRMPPAPAPAPVPSPDAETQQPKVQKRSGIVYPIISGVVIVGLLVSNIVMGVSLSGLKKDIEAVRLNSEQNLSAMEEKVDNIKGGTGTSTGNENESAEGLTPGQVYAQNVESVVAINCSVSSANGQSKSAGSGFIWSADGYVVSNFHVVDGATSITVVAHDGKEYAATLVGGDLTNDICLLKVEAQNLRPASIGSSSDMVVGDRVVAIGNALGELKSTLTVGYVSAIDRVVTTEGSQINMIQTDAAINSGNSGGPLLNMNGEVIGITTAKYSGTTTSGASIEGIGFAIPMDDVIGMLEDLRDHGYITGGYMGIEVTNVDQTDANLYGLPMGVLVHKVYAGSCAEKGGVKAQDILVELGGYSIDNMSDLTRALRKFDAGDTVSVVVYRSSAGGEVVLTLTLDAKPATSSTEESSTVPGNGTADEWFDYFFN